MLQVAQNFLWRGPRDAPEGLLPGTSKKEREKLTLDFTKRDSPNVLAHGPIIRFLAVCCFLPILPPFLWQFSFDPHFHRKLLRRSSIQTLIEPFINETSSHVSYLLSNFCPRVTSDDFT